MTRVIDGDSLVVDLGDEATDIRLIGLNAPEREECFHDEATTRLIDLLEEERAGIETVGTDQFGRALAYLWLGDLLINHDMVAGGFAIATTPDPGDSQGSTLIAAEEAAVSAGVGLWSADACGGTGATPDVSIGPDLQFDPPGRDEESLDRERITLVSPESIDMSGWVVRDESSTHRCLLPPGTSVGPGKDLAISSADPCWDPGLSPVWNNDGDMALLLDPIGRIVARHRYRS